MKDFVIWLVKSIASFPDEVSVEETEENDQILLKLSVAKDDMGKIIGTQGRVIKSIRNLVRVRAIKEGLRVNLELLEQ